MSGLHQKAEDFVLCALADESCLCGGSNDEVGQFLLQLILGHKKGQLIAAPVEELSVKTMRVVASSGRACQEIVP